MAHDILNQHARAGSIDFPGRRLGRPDVATEQLGLAEIETRLASLRRKKVLRRKIALSLVLLDLAAIALAFIAANLVKLETVTAYQITRSLGMFVPIYYGISLHLNVHNASVVENAAHATWKLISAAVTAAMSVVLVIFFLGASESFSRLIFGLGVSLAIIFMSATRWIVAKQGRRYFHGSPYAHLCIYDDVDMHAKSGAGAFDAELLQLHPDLNDMGFVTRLGKLAQGMDKVIVHCRPSRRAQWAHVLHCLDVDTELAWPELNEFNPIAVRQGAGGINLQITTGKLKWHQQTLKRIFDLALTLLLMPFLLPVLAFTAIAIRLETRGPILFRQDRIGLGNRPFKVLKFRSMYADKADAEGSRLTERNDARVTRVGAFIRRTSIDELPQFFNVLKGDMSIVGPRPHPPKALAGTSLYWEVDASYWHRHTLKPGITGLAQVRGFRGNTFSEQHLRDRLQSDLEYVEHWSLIGDLGIFLRTLLISMHKNAF